MIIPYAPPAFPFLVGVSYAILGVSDLSAIAVSILGGNPHDPRRGVGRMADVRTAGGSRRGGVRGPLGAHVAFSRMALTDVSFLLAWLVAIGIGQTVRGTSSSLPGVGAGTGGRARSVLQVQRLADGGRDGPRRASRDRAGPPGATCRTHRADGRARMRSPPSSPHWSMVPGSDSSRPMGATRACLRIREDTWAGSPPGCRTGARNWPREWHCRGDRPGEASPCSWPAPESGTRARSSAGFRGRRGSEP